MTAALSPLKSSLEFRLITGLWQNKCNREVRLILKWSIIALYFSRTWNFCFTPLYVLRFKTYSVLRFRKLNSDAPGNSTTHFKFHNHKTTVPVNYCLFFPKASFIYTLRSFFSIQYQHSKIYVLCALLLL